MRTKIEIFAIVALLALLSAPIAITDTSDADDVTEDSAMLMSLYQSDSFYRSSYAKPYGSSYVNVIYYTEEPCDDAFVKALNGDVSEMSKYAKEPEYNKPYYEYYAGSSYQNSSDIEFQSPAGIYLDKGDYTITVTSHEGVSIGWGTYDTIPLQKGTPTKVHISSPRTVYFVTDSYDQYYDIVNYKIEGYAPTESESTEHMSVKTTNTWVVFTEQFESGDQISCSNAIDLRAYKANSPEDLDFRQDVEKGTAYVGSNDNVTVSENGTYNIYCYMRYTPFAQSYYAGVTIVNTDEYDYIHPTFQVLGGDWTTIYVENNKTFKISSTYDQSKYMLKLIYMDGLYPMTINIASGMEYEITMNSATECYLILDTIEPISSPTVDIFVTITDAPVPDDSSMVFAVVSILIGILFFGLLFVSGMKPRWSKK